MPEVKDIPGYELDADMAGVLRRVHELEAEIATKRGRGEDASAVEAARDKELGALDKLALDEFHGCGRFCPRWRPAPWSD